MRKYYSLILLVITINSSLWAQSEKYRFTDTFNIYSISYPSNFQLYKRNPSVNLWVGPLTSKEDTYQEKLKIELNSIPDTVTLKGLAPMILQRMKAAMKGGKAVGEVSKECELSAQKGWEVSIDGIISGETELVTVSTKLFIVKKILVMITAVKPMMDAVMFLSKPQPIDEIVKSIEFK